MVNIASQTTSFMNELNDQSRPPNDIIVASVNVETNSSSAATDGGIQQYRWCLSDRQE